MNGRKKGGSGFGVVRTVVLAVALGVLAFSGWQLFQIFHVYRESGKEYARLADSYTTPAESIPAVSDGTPSGTPAQTPPYPDIEDAEPPCYCRSSVNKPVCAQDYESQTSQQ